MKKFDKITRDGKYNYHKIGDLITVTENLMVLMLQSQLTAIKTLKCFHEIMN